MNSAPNQLKNGTRPVQQQIRVFRAGEVLSEQGSTSRELFILQKGRAGVYKATAEGEVELAVIEKGGLVGELSLLDEFPQTEKVKALDDVEALVITQQEFQSVLKVLPLWLQSIIKILISRLHAAAKRADQSPLRDKTKGLISLILLLLPAHKKEFNNITAIDYNLIVNEGFFVSRLSKKETQKILEQLFKKEILQFDSESQPGLILIKDPEVLHLYKEYLVLKSQKRTFVECSLPDETVAFLNDIDSVAQKYGLQTDEGTVIMKSAILQDSSKEKKALLDKNLEDLQRKKLIKISLSDNDTAIIFKKEVLTRIKKIKEWIPVFELEVS
jgi:CRP-like cAMP-binding protein